MRQQFKAIAGALIVALCASLAAAQQPETEPDKSDTLRLMTFNIRYGSANDGENSWQHRRELVFDVIREHDADIVGLQESLRFQVDEIKEATDGYSEIGVGRDDGASRGESCSILYKAERFSVASAGTFWLSDTPRVVASASFGNSIPRICTWVRLIDTDSGQGLYILNAHLDHRSDPSRTKSAELIAEFVRNLDFGDPVFLMGDFNAGESSDALAVLTSSPTEGANPEATPAESNGSLFSDSFRMEHPDAADVGTFNSWRGETTGAKIDYILVPPACTVREAEILHTHDDGRYPSDHFPVIAEVVLTNAAADGN